MGLLRFGVGPVAAGEARRKDRGQAERALTHTIGSPTLVVPSESYAELLVSLEKGEVDLAWLPARVAWVDPDSCSGYLFPRVALSEEHGLDPATLFGEERMLGSHDAVMRAATRGEVDCGATYVDKMDDGSTRAGWTRNMPPDTMRIILLSAPIPSDAVCSTPAMPRECRERISAALAELHRSREGSAMLQSLFEVARLEPALPRHYDLVRRAMLGTGSAISSSRFR